MVGRLSIAKAMASLQMTEWLLCALLIVLGVLEKWAVELVSNPECLRLQHLDHQHLNIEDLRCE